MMNFPMEFQPFCLILSDIGIPTSKLATFLPKFLTPSTANKFTVINLFQFAEETCQQDSNLHQASLDVGSLLANILLEETIKNTQEHKYCQYLC